MDVFNDHYPSIRMVPEEAVKIKKKLKKPAYLFHASPMRGLKIIKPRKKTVRDASEGAVVFATPDKIYALMFLVPTDDSWVSMGLFGKTHYMAIADKKRFMANDKGGALYKLSSKTFSCDLTKGGREKEWVSKEPVNVTSESSFEKAKDVLIRAGVQLFFISPKQLSMMNRSKDHGLSVLKKIKPENRQNGSMLI